MKRVLSTVVAFVAILIVIFIFIKRFDVIKEVFVANKFNFFLIAFIYVLSRLADGMKLRVLTAHFGLKLKRYEAFGLAMVMPLYNLIMPHAGMLANAVYLKSKHKFRYTHYLSASLIKFITTIVVCGLFGIIGSTIYMCYNRTSILVWTLAIYIGLMLLPLAIFFLPTSYFSFLRKFRLFSKGLEAIEGLKAMKSERRFLLTLVSLQVFTILLLMLRYYTVLRTLSLNAPFLSMLVVTPLTEVSNLMSLIPSNLAIREAVLSGGLTLIGHTLDRGLLVASLDRVILLTTTLILGSWFFIRLKHSSNIIISKDIIDE